jgi:hypothetical protein
MFVTCTLQLVSSATPALKECLTVSGAVVIWSNRVCSMYPTLSGNKDAEVR